MLKHKVADANELRSPLIWFGYQIPPGFAIRSEFQTNVYLNGSNFLGDAAFIESTFERNAFFSNVKFNGEARFCSAGFNGQTNFDGVHFKDASFSGAFFDEDVNFSGAIFKGEANFIGSFNGKASFAATTFNRKAYFKETEFNGGAEFDSATFNGETFLPIKGNFIFIYVLLKEQAKVFFNGDLYKVSFANTDITRVRFGDKVQWGRKKRNSGNDESEEKVDFKIYDEWLIEEGLKKKNKESTNSLEAVIAE